MIHGGDNGELPPTYIDRTDDSRGSTLSSEKSETLYIFEHTFEQIQAVHVKSRYFLAEPSKKDNGSMLPLVSDIFKFVADKVNNPKGTLMHIELKVPRIEEIKQRYRFKQAVS